SVPGRPSDRSRDQGRAEGPDARLPGRRQQRGPLAPARLHENWYAHPGGHPSRVVHRAREIATQTGGAVEVLRDPAEACSGADVLYTDVWASMGQEGEADERGLVFRAYQLNERMVQLGAPDVPVLHCLPAHRGQEITDEVIDGPHSAVWDQAENRMHTQKALLLFLLGVA